MPAPAADKAAQMLSQVFEAPVRETVAAELEQFFQRCEQQNVSRTEAQNCLASWFTISLIVEDSDRARGQEKQKR